MTPEIITAIGGAFALIIAAIGKLYVDLLKARAEVKQANERAAKAHTAAKGAAPQGEIDDLRATFAATIATLRSDYDRLRAELAAERGERERVERELEQERQKRRDVETEIDELRRGLGVLLQQIQELGQKPAWMPRSPRRRNDEAAG